MMNVNTMKNDNVDPLILSLLDELKPVPPRNTRAAAHGRASFLSEAVSAREKQRHNLWTIFQQKEQFVMKLVISTLLIGGLLFGGNATVSAAQDALPNQPLYQIKLMSEDMKLWFVSDANQQVQLLMQQVQNRLEEMRSLTSEGVSPPTALMNRAQERIQRALHIATGLDDPSKVALLQQLRTRLQTQEQLMEQFQQSNCEECVPVLQQTREMLRTQLREVEDDLATPEPAPLQLQNQNQNQNQYQNQVRTTQTPQPIATATSSSGMCTPAPDSTGQQNSNPSAATPMQQKNQTGGDNQKGPGSGGGNQNGGGSGGNGPSSGSGGQGGKP
jgi:uncharacterized membrane protein YgcG